MLYVAMENKTTESSLLIDESGIYLFLTCKTSTTIMEARKNVALKKVFMQNEYCT